MYVILGTLTLLTHNLIVLVHRSYTSHFVYMCSMVLEL